MKSLIAFFGFIWLTGESFYIVLLACVSGVVESTSTPTKFTTESLTTASAPTVSRVSTVPSVTFTATTGTMFICLVYLPSLKP